MTQETKEIREERIAMGCLGCYNEDRDWETSIFTPTC